MTRPFIKLQPDRRQLVLLAVLVLGLYAIVPQLGDFRSSWQLLRHPQPGFTALAIGLTLLTYLAGAATYCCLAFEKLPFWRTVLAQLAAMFINRLLPAGSGALGVNYLYLRRQRHNAAQAATVLAINNLWGFMGNTLLVTGALLVFREQPVPSGGLLNHSFGPALKVGAAVIILCALAGVVYGRQRLRKLVTDIRQQLAGYRQRPGVLAAALLSSMALTLANVLCLLCCLLALGVHLPFITVLLILSVGVGVGAATPTPGGLGGFEAGLVAALIAFGVENALALAVALLYRVVSYWLMLAVGAVAFGICQRRHLFDVASA